MIPFSLMRDQQRLSPNKVGSQGWLCKNIVRQYHKKPYAECVDTILDKFTNLPSEGSFSDVKQRGIKGIKCSMSSTHASILEILKLVLDHS